MGIAGRVPATVACVTRPRSLTAVKGRRWSNQARIQTRSTRPRCVALVRDVPDFPQTGIIFQRHHAAARKRSGPPLRGRRPRGVVPGDRLRYRHREPGVHPRCSGGLCARGRHGAGTQAGAVTACKQSAPTMRWSTARIPSRFTRMRCGPGERVLIIDDVLATGGTAAATAELVERLGARSGGDRGADRATGARRTRAIGGLRRHQSVAVLSERGKDTLVMIDVGLMIEGQLGVNWPRWQRLARVAEDAGYAGLYRSDHFTEPRDRISTRSSSGLRSPGWRPIPPGSPSDQSWPRSLFAIRGSPRGKPLPSTVSPLAGSGLGWVPGGWSASTRSGVSTCSVSMLAFSASPRLWRS